MMNLDIAEKKAPLEYRVNPWFQIGNLDYFHVLPKKNQQWIRDPVLVKRHKTFIDTVLDMEQGVPVDWTAHDKVDLVKMKAGDYDWVFLNPEKDTRTDNNDFLFYLSES